MWILVLGLKWLKLHDLLNTNYHLYYFYFVDHPFNLLVNGKFNETVPAMIGVTKNEGGLFVLNIPGR